MSLHDPQENMPTRARLERAKAVLTALYVEARTENLTFMAGSIAYHAFVSLLPLLVLLVVVLRGVGGASLSDVILDVVAGAFTEGGRRLILQTVESGDTTSGVGLLGLAVLAWATLRIFRGIDQAFSDIYETEGTNSLPDQIADGLLVFGAVVAAVVGVGLVRTTFTLGDGVVGSVLGTLFVLVALSVALFPMYLIFPDADLRPVEALPGTVAAAVGFAVLEALFRIYTDLSTTGEAYGVVGAIVVLVTWLYFNGLVLLLGAVVNAVLTNKTADVVIEPVIGDHRVGLGPADAAGEGRTATAVEVDAEFDLGLDRDGDGPMPGVDVAGDVDLTGLDRPGTVARRLRSVAGQVEAASSMTVVVAGERTELPSPAVVRMTDDPEDGVELRLQW